MNARRWMLALATLPLVACGADVAQPAQPARAADGGTRSFQIYEQRIVLEDGREVVCVVFPGSAAGGMSCDWTEGQR